MTRILRLALLVVAILAALVAVFFLAGGRTGLALWVARYVLHEESAPFREVIWQKGPTEPVAQRKPNVILIVVDDLGYDDLTALGSGVAGGRVPTPNIDSLARDGIRFDVAYSGNATCAPSRAAIMTGRYATRFGFEFTPAPTAFMRLISSGINRNPGEPPPLYFSDRASDQPPVADMGLPTSEITIAKLLQKTGYHTVQIGKWHLGDSPRYRAYAHGFNESLSLQYGAAMYLPEDDPRVVTAVAERDLISEFIIANEPWGVRFNDGEIFEPNRYLTDYLTDEAVRVVDANRNRPFFLYLAYNAPHTPLQATRADYDALPFIEDRTLRVYAAMLRSLDRNIGRLLDGLRERGLEQDTLILFTSDNGAPHYAGVGYRNQPYRGWKATYFEGGIRVPFLMRWPSTLPAGKMVSGPAAHFDIFSTIAAAADASVPQDRIIDGVNLLPFARGEARGRPHGALFWRTDDYLTLRLGDWKLQTSERSAKTWLFDLSTDPLERINLATRDPARVADMKARLEEFNKQQSAPLWQSLAANPVPIDRSSLEPPKRNEEFVYFSN
ncbi:MAG: sulfatase [Gammaproteobacteria bacterium]|nr:sulfatase [Gammaproteobacteria bacterium]